MSDIFISYSRRDSEFMHQLHGRLTDDGYDVWVDFEDIPPTADWWKEIKDAIDEADAFAFIISPDSLRSDVCRDEIEHAVSVNKRFIPILYRDLKDVDTSFIHPAVRTHNWILFSMAENFDEGYETLVESFTTNPEHLRRHTRLLVRAREWIESNRQQAYLLEGAELQEFQDWLTRSQKLTPKPTELQYDFILASQTKRTRDQARLAAGIITAVVIVAILAVFVFFQREQIEEQQLAQNRIEATAFAQGTQLAAQQTSIADARSNATTIIQQANVANTQSALEGQINALSGTVSAFETIAAFTATPLPISSATPTTTLTASATGTSTLPPTWTPTAAIQVTQASETSDGDAQAASVDTATSDPNIVASATAQANLYSTATANALIVPTATATSTTTPTATVTPSPTVMPSPTFDAPDAVGLSTQVVTYVVQDGDFAIDIANRFGITVRELVDFNELSNASLIFVGQQLRIPFQLGIDTDVTLLVAPTGQDTDDCGGDTMPCRTIAHAYQIAEGFAQIRIASGVYQETLVFDKDVALVGNGIENTIVTGDFEGTVLTVNPNTNVTVVGMTITGGNDIYGGGIVNYGELTMQNALVSGNVADLVGGGVANFGSFFGDFVDFRDNYAPYFVDIYSSRNAGAISTDTMNYIAETRLPNPDSRTDGSINIGVLVAVTTTEGDRLNMRSRPTVNAEDPSPLNPGTVLLIIDGPERNNNFRWWQVQTAVGTSGWVVDFDDEATIRPVEELLRQRNDDD